MKIGLNLPYSTKVVDVPMDLIRHAETLGFDSVWIPEVYGADAVSISAWILAQTETIRMGTAIMQIPARTPACTAMTAMSLSQLSGGRFILGLGASGPQVVEGWHGVGYRKPITRTKEYISVIRQIMAREAPVEFDGEFYQLPYLGPDSSGLGKPLKSLLRKDESIPIYTASFTPAGLAAAAEVADGVFPIWYNPERFDLFEPHLQKGFEKSPGKTLDTFDFAPSVGVVVGDDLEFCRAPIKQFMGLYIGGMGARNKNFYNDYTVKLGFEAEAKEIQDLYLAGHHREAVAAVPDELVDQVSLVGPKDRIRDHAQRWQQAAKETHIGSLLFSARQPEAIELLAEIFL